MAKLATLVEKYRTRALSTARLSAAVLANRVITRTPVDKSSLQNSWTANNGPPIANNVTVDQVTPYPERTKITQVVNSLKIGDTFSFANGKPYARRIEYEGWSAKRPEGMLRVSVAEWDAIVAQVAKAQKSGG